MQQAIERNRRTHPWLGGEMELSLDMLCANEALGVSWPFESCQTVMSGRTALKLIAQKLEVRSNGERIVLLPAYVCPSVLQPFQEEGFSVGFYRIHADLTIDLDDLVHLVETVRPSGLLFINYFGFPVGQVVRETLCEIKERVWVIEDCAQGSLVEQRNPLVGQIGDFVITSFRKYLAVPDGGLVINRTDMALPPLPPARERFVRYRLLGKLLRYEFLQGNLDQPELEEMYLALFAAAESDLDTDVPLYAISRISERLLGMIDLSDAMAKRRRNFSFLLKAFVEEPRLQSIGSPVLTVLPPGVSPLAFPIRVAAKKRNALRRELIARQVFCPIHWHLPAEIQEGRFSESCQLSQQILSLPIDQRYEEEDIENLIDRVLQAWEAIT